MKCPKCRKKIDLSRASDAELKAERARRNVAKRTTHSGGSAWSRHYPDRKNCKCVDCNARRDQERVLASLVVRA